MYEKRIHQLKQRFRRQASKMVLGGTRQLPGSLTSWFGKVTHRISGEEWPEYEGQLMWPLCQINCEELPFTPLELIDIAVIWVYVGRTVTNWGLRNGDGWALRACANSDRKALVPVEEPVLNSEIRPVPIRWELEKEDYPSWEDYSHLLSREEIDYFLNEKKEPPLKKEFASKVGGWPSYLQGEIFPWVQHTFMFQIDSEPKAYWAWGHQGLGYFALDPLGEWILEWQCL